jgi:hypothetical protein
MFLTEKFSGLPVFKIWVSDIIYSLRGCGTTTFFEPHGRKNMKRVLNGGARYEGIGLEVAVKSRSM